MRCQQSNSRRKRMREGKKKSPVNKGMQQKHERCRPIETPDQQKMRRAKRRELPRSMDRVAARDIKSKYTS